jgi:hypothetical protein
MNAMTRPVICPGSLDKMGLVRYVILHHTGVDEPHYDVMFESSPGGPLHAWRSGTWPVIEPTHFTPLPDHRTDYLTYEGPLSDDRGEVKRVASGTCVITLPSADQYVVRFGDDAIGTLVMTRTAQDRWTAMPMRAAGQS